MRTIPGELFGWDFFERETPESGIPPSYRATRRYTKVHLDFCLRFSTLIGQIGRVPLFAAGPRRYIRSRLFRLAVTAFWRALTASWRQKGKRKQIFPPAIRTTELPSNPSPLTFRNNQIQTLQTSSTHATMTANVSQQDTNTHGTWLSHARTHTTRDKGTKALTVPRRPAVRPKKHCCCIVTKRGVFFYPACSELFL